jgi:NitT/TauT family transport system ATP-binding protein
MAVLAGGISVEGVSKRFFRRRADSAAVEALRVLDGVSLQIRDSEFLSLIGPSGCGKTTLLRMIAGLVEWDDGRIVVDGTDVTGPGPERAMVFQDFALLPWADVLANVSFGLKLRGVSRQQRDARARELVELVGLRGFEASLPRQLLLLDEPFGALDEISRRVMQDELIRIWEAEKKTAVFVTHAVDEAVFLSDRIAVMSARPGRISEIIDVDLPRPRAREMEQTPTFIQIRARVWKALGI